MSEELNNKIQELCDLCAREKWRFDMTFVYDPKFWCDILEV